MLYAEPEDGFPATQARLPAACCAGDIRHVERLLASEVGGWRGWLLRWLGLGKQTPASLDFMYTADLGCRSVLHFIASGIPSNHPHLGRLYRTDYVTCRAGHGPDRAELLRWLCETDRLPADLDWNIQDCCGRTPVFWAVSTHSVDVLEVFCGQAQKRGITLDVCNADRSNVSPLDVAVASQQWRAVKILVKLGGLVECVRLQSALDSLKECAPDVVGPRPPRQAGSIATMLGAFLGSSAAKALASLAFSPADSQVDSDEDVRTLPTPLKAPRVFSSMREVEEFWNQQATYVSKICSVDDGLARHLLRENAHDVDAAIRAYLIQKSPLQSEDSGSQRPASMLTCQVCFETFPPWHAPNVVLACRHHTACSECWRSYVQSCIQDGLAAHMQCMEPGCHMPVPLAEAQKVLDAESYERLQGQVLRSYVDSNPNIKWCPRPGCGFSLSLADHLEDLKGRNVSVATLQKGPLTVRCACGHSFCWICLEEPHEPASCEEVRSWKKLLDEEHVDQNRESEAWLQTHTQPCPTCQAKVQRTGGCNHMVCAVCGQHFCYVCGRDWGLHGPQTGGFYVCTLREVASQFNTPLELITRHVTTTLRSAFRMLYTRQRECIRRYLDHSDDGREARSLLRHIARLLAQALPSDDVRGTPAARAAWTASWGGWRPTRASGAASGQRGCVTAGCGWSGVSAADSAAPAGAGLEGLVGCGGGDGDGGSASGSGVSEEDDEEVVERGWRTTTHLGEDFELYSSLLGDYLRRAEDVSQLHERPALFEKDDRALLAWEGPEQGLPVAAAGTDGAAPGGPVLKPGCQELPGTSKEAERARWSQLSPSSRWKVILKEWERSMALGRCMLRNTIIAIFYMERGSERQQLEALQVELEDLVGQLSEMLRCIPHRRMLLEHQAHDAGTAQRQGSLVRQLASWTVGNVATGAHFVLCCGLRLLNTQREAVGEVSEQGQQIRDQFYYVVALHEQRSRIVQLLQRVNKACHLIVKVSQARQMGNA